MKKILGILILGAFLVLSPAKLFAASPIDNVCGSNVGNGTNKSALCEGGDKTTVNDPITGGSGLILKAVQIISLITGVAAVFVIIIAGIRFMTASGDPSSINQAKNTILYAVIGLIVSVFSQVMVAFVINRIL